MPRSPCIGLLLTLAGGAAALATTFVPMSDEALMDRAEAIAEVRILSVESSPGSRAPSTDYLIEVEQLLAGYLPGTAVVLRVLGGQRPDGTGLRIWGAPRFEQGDRALLMLEAHEDGTFRLTQFLLGAFVQRRAGGRRLAIRDLREASTPDGAPGGLEVRDWQLFRSWIADRRSGLRRPADYLQKIPDAQFQNSLSGQFTLLGENIHLRWFEFDQGESVPFHAHSSGQHGLSGGGFEIFQRAIHAWNLDPGSNVSYHYAGKTLATGGLYDIDGVNTLLFNDPRRDLGGPYDCRYGGVIALGGPWIGAATEIFRGERYRVITGADIVTNANLACFFADSPDAEKAAEEIFGHNLGHTLGLGNSCGGPDGPACVGQVDEALMRGLLHDDGRGAWLTADDRSGIASLYPLETPSLPDAPDGLMAIRRSREPTGSVTAWVTWQDRAESTIYFELERRLVSEVSNESFQVVASPPADPATSTPGLIVGDHRDGETYEYRVRAFGDTGPSEFSAIYTLVVPSMQTPCIAQPSRACVLGERFQIDVQWRNQHDFNAPGLPVATSDLGDRTTAFAFFDPDVVDLIVKVLDGTSLSGHYWVFYGALSDVEYWITVTDTESGSMAFYHNPPGEICGMGDTYAIRSLGATSSSVEESTWAIRSPAGLPPSASCTPDNETLCLLDGRFQIRVLWTDEVGAQGSGVGRTIPATDESGFFWFFRSDNTELAVKVLDGRGVNDRFWFFYGALSDVAYEITVTDTQDGTSRIYGNAQGHLCGEGDTAAF